MPRHRAIAAAFARPVRYAAPVGDDMAAMHRRLHDDPDFAPIYADWLEDHDMPTVAAIVRRNRVGPIERTHRHDSSVWRAGAGGFHASGLLHHGWITIYHPSLVAPMATVDGETMGRHFQFETNRATPEMVEALRDEGVRISPSLAAGREGV